jgi:two-component system chemotaxis sensor kinase CheA
MSDAEIVREFLVESYENLDRLDRDLVTLEENPGDRQILAGIFRTIHTIKGTSGFLAFNRLEAVTHVGENLLARLRDGLLQLRPEITTALLAMVDAVRQMLGNIEANGNEGERDDRQLLARLTELQAADARPGPVAVPPTQKAEEKEKACGAGTDLRITMDEPSPEVSEARPGVETGATTVPQGENIPLKDEGCTEATSEKAVSESEAEPKGARLSEGAIPRAGETKGEEEVKVGEGIAKAEAVAAAADGSVFKAQGKPDSAEASAPATSSGPSASDSTIRVDVGQLDRLMNRVGELVLLRNQIVQFANKGEDGELLGTSQRLNLLTTELQEGVMKTRMQPIGNIWSKFPRTVRDVALSCGKQVRIEMEGKETELDKTIIEAIKDPLTHLVRNAVDHGVEAPEVRKAVGKDPEGRLSLRAFHEGGQVNIEITDDGAGLDLEKIRNKAVQKGLVNAEHAARMSEREIVNLIFLPGLSTAQKVTNVSGRGVGMDVVRTNIEKIGGTVDVQSTTGKGSTVRMKIPLTLAIIPALIVTSAGDRYAIPQVSLLELVRLEGEQARKGIEMVNNAPVYRLRGRLLPLVYLNRELQVEARAKQAGAGAGHAVFQEARDKHGQRLRMVQEVLDGRITFTPGQAGSHEGCGLGKWLYGRGMADLGDFTEARTLEEMHRQFHEHMQQALTQKQEGNVEQAAQALAAMERALEKMMPLLTTVEHKVQDLGSVNMVVLRADDRQFGLVVDEINDTQEIVVKPLSKQLKSINAYAGATIMGDGKVALILDVHGLAQRARMANEMRDRALAEAEDRPAVQAGEGTRRTMLLFQNGARERMAVDLSLVARLEEFEQSMIEVAGGQESVQYRGHIMPLVRVAQILGGGGGFGEHEAEERPLQAVVYTDNGRSVGLVIDRILDIVDETVQIQPNTSRTGVQGAAVIQKRTTEVLDIPGLLAAVQR